MDRILLGVEHHLNVSLILEVTPLVRGMMTVDAAGQSSRMQELTPIFLLTRLREDGASSTVSGSLPVLFFGDPFAASIATIGINPSCREYLTRDGRELEGSARRFETIRSLGVGDRFTMDEARAITAIERMRGYFDSGRPIYNWFNGLCRVTEGMGFSFEQRSAVHLDLVQEATDPVWSRFEKIDRAQAQSLMARDLQFLRRQIDHFPLRAVVCTSARVTREVTAMLRGRIVAQGVIARVCWSVAVAEIPRGVVGVAAWNIPLARPTGLDRDGQRTLGKVLRTQLEKAGVVLGV